MTGRIASIALLGVATCFFTAATCSTWYVDRSASAGGDGTSWETAFRTIQQGIDAASDNDTVLVAPGNYVENVHFGGKNIILTGTNPFDPDTVANTIIQPGKGGGSVVAFQGTEDETCVLSGFTIRDGDSSIGGGVRGGTTDAHAHATIRHNVISSNVANQGAGLAYCDGLIENNTISENHGYNGGGLYQCNGMIRRNTISGNTADYAGGGLHGCGAWIADNRIMNNTGDTGSGLAECHGTIANNVISGNGGGLDSGSFVGGGLVFCNGTIWNNVITGNSCFDVGGGLLECGGTIQSNLIAGNASHSGALADCGGIIRNNTIVGNVAHHDGSGAIEHCSGAIENCVIWGNTEFQISDSSEPTYTCIQGWTGGGTNIGADPLFVSPGHWDDNGTPTDPMDDLWVDGDYRLTLDSPCIDVGDSTPLSPPGLDLDGNLRIALGKSSSPGKANLRTVTPSGPVTIFGWARGFRKARCPSPPTALPLRLRLMYRSAKYGCTRSK